MTTNPGDFPAKNNDDLKSLSMAEVEKRLGSSQGGLTEAEARSRLALHGPNEIAERKTNGLLKFLGYFWGPIPWMIEVAVILPGIVRHWPDFFTRTRGPFWSIRPARILWIAVIGTQILATLIAVHGVFVTPLGWRWAGFVWGYALAWFLQNDRIKLLAYRIFDPVKAESPPLPC